MKRFGIFISIVLSILLGSCDAQPLPSSAPNLVEHIYSRGIIDGTSLPLNSQALFNTTGHTPINNEVFTFNGEVWENENISIPLGTQSLTALYPAYNGNTFITINPYKESALEDVLISQNALTHQTNLHLEFKHLFAKLTIHVISAINETLTGVSVTVPKVSAINPIDGSLTFSGEHSTYLSCTSIGDYTFIIPSKENCPLKLTFSFENEDDIEKEITHTFVSGHQYECNVTNTDTRPGIKTVQDLIDFSLFINGKSSKRSWSDFGIETSEGRVYRLLADLDFENKTYSNLLPIGYDNSTSSTFNAIFDGGGHTISNFIIPDKSINPNVQKDHSGLFGRIGENGIVRNLNIDNANSVKSPTCTHIGGIAAYNYGTIINCSVQNSTFYTIEYTGGICSRLSAGYIINCHTTNNTIHSNEDAFTGGIAGDANGYILNCYTYKNILSTKQCGGSKNGGLVGTNSPDHKLTIANCYVNHSSLIASNSANAVGQAKYVSIDNFMYNLNMNICLETLNVEITNENRYPSSTYCIGETHISTILNNWIDNPNRTEYADIPFKHWTNTNPPTFTE